MRLLPCLLFATAAFAGQSIQYGTQNIYNETAPTTPVNRLEFCIHDWTPDSYTHLVAGPGGAYGNGATGWVAYLQVQGLSGLGIAARNSWDNGEGTFLPLGGLAVTEVYVRLHSMIRFIFWMIMRPGMSVVIGFSRRRCPTRPRWTSESVCRSDMVMNRPWMSHSCAFTPPWFR